MFKMGKYRHKEKRFEIVVTNTGIYFAQCTNVHED